MGYTVPCLLSSEMTTHSDEILHGLIHDLRQPLGNLETSLFYLEMLHDHPSDRVLEQLRMMARQVRLAMQVLDRASQNLRVAQSQREGVAASDSLPLTKSATAAVT